MANKLRKINFLNKLKNKGGTKELKIQGNKDQLQNQNGYCFEQLQLTQ